MTTTSLDAPRRPGRPRDPELAERVLAATSVLLAEVGFAGLSMDRIAERARVSKATIYARWPSKAELIVEAVANQIGGEPPEAPDTGDVAADLRTLLEALCGAMRGPFGRVMAPLIGELVHDAELASTFRQRFVTPRQGRVRQTLELGRSRGQLHPDADIDLLADVGAAVVFQRLLVTGEALGEELPERLVRQLIGPWLTSRPEAGRP